MRKTTPHKTSKTSKDLSCNQHETTSTCLALVLQLSQSRKPRYINENQPLQDNKTSFSNKNIFKKRHVIARNYARVEPYRGYIRPYMGYIGGILRVVSQHFGARSRASVGQGSQATRRHCLQVHEPRSRWSTRPTHTPTRLSCRVRRIESAWTKTASLAGAQVRADQALRPRGVRRRSPLADRGGAR